MSTNTQHAILSASGSARWMACPGSVGLTRKLKPKEHRSRYAEEGTAAHMLFESAMANEKDADHYMGVDFLTPAGNSFQVGPDMARAVQVMLNHCAGLALNSKQLWGVETRVRLDKLTSKHGIRERAFGTVDFWALVRDTLHVVDYKHGQGVPVNVEGNSQAMYYALGLLYRAENPPKHAEITIVQPRAEHIEGPVRSRRMPAVDLLMWGEDELAPAMKKTEDPAAQLVPGSHCRFCPCMSQCPALKALAEKTAQDEFGSAVTLDSVPHGLTDVELANILDREKAIRHWLDACRAEASSRIESGHVIPNYKLVEKRSTRYWSMDPKVMLEEVCKQYGIHGDDIRKGLVETKVKSPAQAEKVFLDLGLSFDWMERDYIEKKSSGTTLVRKEDPRTEVLKQATEFGSAEG